MRLEMRHLVIVLTTADLGTLRQAAPALGMSQIALKAQLRRIEQALGGNLFRHDNNAMELTDLGRTFVCGARNVITRFDALRARVADSAKH
ncbi:helix-turn-helix domain-containing protein [Actinokineospora xionganensis]|uniref:LysR family transcriptional regulator n=1 Tax=Actinokineospora xionganensis TaxID=2684470 RepID=A0ABR7LG17_9PSEU|nr:LysR family transcriptional regulator [Actinokineospora xionganensis]MBC6451237.1 LysR family transcriptional regulator [Actinokineospora xionganensis]